MKKFLYRYRMYFISFFCITIPLFSIYYHSRHNNRTSPIEEFTLNISGRTESIFSALIDITSEIFNNYINLINTQQENESLKKQNELLTGEALNARRLFEENERLKFLCGFKAETNEMETLPARVIGKTFSEQNFKVIRAILDAGEDDGIKEGMPVITHLGVVGRVSKIESRFCEIMLIVDSRSRISVEISSRGVVGILVGKDVIKGYGCKFVFWERNESIKEGDVLTTTGYGKSFPRGLTIGFIKNSEIKQAGLYFEVDVSPAVDFAKLEEVLVVKNFGRE